MNEKTTDIICFECNKRYGIDCPGRKEGESTRCEPCFIVYMCKVEYEQNKHLLDLLNRGELGEEQFRAFAIIHDRGTF